MRRGATGHWAGDAACKFPSAGSKPQASQPRAAMMAYMSDSSSDDGDCVILTHGHSSTPTAMMGYSVARGRPKGAPKPTAKPSVPVPLLVAERVENTDPQTLQVVTNLTGDGAGDRMSSAEIQAVLAVFTQSLLDSGPKSPANLHKELDDAIIEVMAVQDPEAYPPDSDDPED
ncbi:unnamed protein product [Cladocopium goreaui]|nr:unnamed protein product [Cladocopium goreaui]